MKCSKCGGAIVLDYDEIVCFNCGKTEQQPILRIVEIIYPTTPRYFHRGKYYKRTNDNLNNILTLTNNYSVRKTAKILNLSINTVRKILRDTNSNFEG